MIVWLKANYRKVALAATFVGVILVLYNQATRESYFIGYPLSGVQTYSNESITSPTSTKQTFSNESFTSPNSTKLQFVPTAKPSDAAVVNVSSWLADWVPPTLNSHLVKTYPFLLEPIVNPHPFNYTIYPSHVNCSSRDIELAICVPSSRKNFDSRQTVRETWGSYANVTGNWALLVFFIGSEAPGVSSETQRRIEEEARAFGDILQESYLDNYKNLSLKTVSIIKWVTTFCPGSKYLLKTDDDLYVNVPWLVRMMTNLTQSSGKTSFVLGYEYSGNKPNRDRNSKFYTPTSMFKGDVYPNYVLGATYAMTAQAAWLLNEASLRVPLFWIEDIFLTGLCAPKAGVSFVHNNLFSYDKLEATGCVFRNRIAHHKYSLEEIREIHKQVYDPNTVCKKT